MSGIKIRIAPRSLPDARPEKVQHAFQDFLKVPKSMVKGLEPTNQVDSCAGCAATIEQLGPKASELRQKMQQAKSIFDTQLMPAIEELSKMVSDVNEAIRKRKCTYEREAGSEEEDGTIAVNTVGDLMAILIASQLTKRAKKETN